MEKLTSTKMIGLAALIVAVSIAYHYVIYIPRQDNLAKEQQADAMMTYKACVSLADMSFREEWNSYCEANPIWQDKGTGKCASLRTEWVNDINAGIDRAKARCLAELKAGIK